MNMTSKRILAVGVPLCLVIATGVAVAFFTGSGGGTGTATSSTGVTVLSVNQAAISGLAPGAPASLGDISGTVGNPSSQSAYVTSVTASLASVAKAAGAPAGTCDASDYSLTNAVMAVGANVAAGGTAPFSGANLSFVNKATNQDACKGATVTLSYAVA
jgi:hypothetical protein